MRVGGGPRCMLNPTLEHQLTEALAPRTSERCAGLGCEASLRVAAGTLCRTRPAEVTATTVVGVLGRDDVAALEALVGDIASEFGLQSRMRMSGATFSVRFSRFVEEQ